VNIGGTLGTMAEPFSIAAGIVGVLGLAIQTSQIVLKFGLDWKNASEEIRSFRSELQSLQMTLTEIQTKLVSNPSFEAAFDGNSSALLSHLKADNLSNDCIKEAFEGCHSQLTEAINNFKRQEERRKLGWEHFKAAFLSARTSSAVSRLQRQCQRLNQLMLIDTAVITASTHREVQEVRKEHQAWHIAKDNHKILCWLSQLSFEEKHRDILSKLHPGTGQWLLDMDAFKAWRNGQLDHPPTLWCPGIRQSTHSRLIRIVEISKP
jgi:hypothetical protein